MRGPYGKSVALANAYPNKVLERICVCAYIAVMDSITPLRRVRVEKLKMRQAEAAQIMGVAQTTVSRWERGEGEPFLSCVGALIAEAAKRGVTLTVEDFFDGEAAA